MLECFPLEIFLSIVNLLDKIQDVRNIAICCLLCPKEDEVLRSVAMMFKSLDFRKSFKLENLSKNDILSYCRTQN